MNTEKFQFKLGRHMIENLLEPNHWEIDLEAIELRLQSMKRFSGHPLALTVMQHSKLVAELVSLDPFGVEPSEKAGDLWMRCREWAKYHDYHEGVTGDIVAPIKRIISSRTNILEIIETKLDMAICEKASIPYPTETVRGLVYRYDKAAETMEWHYAMELPLEDWNHPCPGHLFDRGRELIQWARTQ